MSPSAWLLLRPWFLLALIPVAALAWRLWRRGHGQPGGPWIDRVDRRLHSLVLVDDGAVGGEFLRMALPLALALAVIALAGPAQRLAEPPVLWRSDVARALVVDLSTTAQSTGRGDAATLERAALSALLDAGLDGEIALLAYAGTAFVIVPFTSDPEVLRRFVPELSPDIMPRPGSDPAAALEMAAEILQRNGARVSELLWITPGAEAPKGLHESTLKNVRLTVIQVGKGEVGKGEVGNGAQGAGGRESLSAFVAERGGTLIRFPNAAATILAESLSVANAGYRAGVARTSGQVRDFGPWILLGLLPLFALLGRRAGLLSAPLPVAFLGGLLVLSGLSPAPAVAGNADDRAAYQHWLAGDFTAAAEAFADPQWRAVALYRTGRFAEAAAALAGNADVDAVFNRGNALARAGDLQGALEAFEAVLARRPDDADAHFNRDLVRDLLATRDAGGGGSPSTGPRPDPDRQRDPQREADLLAADLQRRLADDVDRGLLRRKLEFAQQRRDQANEAGR